MKLTTYVTDGAFYKAVVEDGSDLIFIVDFDGHIHYHNASVSQTLGYAPSGLIGRNFFHYILPISIEEFKFQFKLNQKRAYTEKVEFQFLCSDGSYKFLEYNAINLKHKEDLNGFILDCRDITQRKRDAEELVKLQKAKEQFLANISHEIRTPINGIAGMASLLSQSNSLEDQATYLTAIKHSAENLKVIINDILDLAAIESGKLKFERIAFNLKDLLPALINTFAYQAKEKNINLTYSIEDELNRILLGDPVRLNQILINLISNAVKFTHAGSIQVSCSIDHENKKTCWVRFEVTDTGVGIPAEKLNTIFESFSQADASVTRKYGGTGLGLTIVKQLVELQEGKITVRSEEQKGSTFIVLIPYGTGKLSGLTEAEASRIQINEHLTKPLQVLLVEDNDINRLYAKSILKKWHCHVDIAENGLVAIEKIKNHVYDIVLMDVQMPVMDGYEATKAIRLMDSEVRNIPIIALTANATKNDIALCIASGMNDYLPKPFTPDDLHRKIFEDLNIQPAILPQHTSIAEVSKSYDFTYLKSISENNQTFIDEMVTTFIQTMPPILDEIESHIKNKNWTKIGKLAHQVKPSYTLLGINKLKSRILNIEESCKNPQNENELSNLIKEFISQTKEVLRDLSHELPS